MTFKELCEDAIQNSFPDGLPTNLRRQARNAVIDALIQAQKYCVAPGRSDGYYQQAHMEIYQQCATFFYGGMTVVPVPAGQVTAIYTNKPNAWFCRVDYTPLPNFQALKRWVSDWGYRHHNECVRVGWPVSDSPEPGHLKTYPKGGKCFGRAGYGHFCINNNKIYVAPFIEEDEQLVVEWSGIKRSWNDDDIVTIDYDRDLVRYVELYVAYDIYTRWYQETQQAALLNARMRDAFAELIDTAIDKMTPHKTAGDSPLRTSLVTCSVTGPECIEIGDGAEALDSTNNGDLVVGFVGDIQLQPGENADAEIAVQNLITSWNPNAIILGGDLREQGMTYIDTFNTLIGYASYLNFDDARKNKLWPVLGNHDVDDAGRLAEWYEYFKMLPNNKRYYEVAVGPAHFFVLNSYGEPDGVTSTSAQAEWLKIKMRSSGARWKIVVLHVPPYSSKLNYQQQTLNGENLQWPYDYMGADLVLSGHNHHYERIIKNRVTYIICGTGGEEPFAAFGTPIAGSQFTYNQSHGALKLSINCDRIKGQFFAVTQPGVPLDAFEIVKP